MTVWHTAMSNDNSPTSTRKQDQKREKQGKFATFLRDILPNGSAPCATVKSGKTVNDVPNKQIMPIDEAVLSAFSAPSESLTCIQAQRNARQRCSEDDVVQVAGIEKWNQRPNEAYGIQMSLYDYDRRLDRTVGDPVADCLSIVVRPNNSILVLADGVSWGEKSKLAACSAVYGCTSHLLANLKHASTTREVFIWLMSAFQNAQACIIEEDGTMTTLCAAVVVQLKDKQQWAVCVLNVGDSLAYVYNPSLGVREVTSGSHPLDEDRDMRNAGGALGQVDGHNPDLANLTCSYTVAEDKDIVFLTSDGISDNFDPVVALFEPSPGCVQRFNPLHRKSSLKLQTDKLMSKTRSLSFTNSSLQPTISPLERHCGSLEKMTEILEDSKNTIGRTLSAISLCASFVNYALQNTQRKREVHEAMDFDLMKQMTSVLRRQQEEEYRMRLDSTPGKLDHASIAALQVGYYGQKVPSTSHCNVKATNEEDEAYIICHKGDLEGWDGPNAVDQNSKEQVTEQAFCALK